MRSVIDVLDLSTQELDELIADEGIINSQSSAYAPQGKIRVAHVLNMEPTDIAAWQQ